MNKQEILKKAIKKAKKKGYRITKDNQCFFDNEIDFKYPYLFYSSYLGIWKLHINEIIFSHSFAKAFWGEKSGLSPCCNVKLKIDKYGDRFCSKCNSGSLIILSKMPMWKVHLQQMILEKEPLKYLEKFLDENKNL